MELFKPEDLDAAFMAYRDLPIEIAYGGFRSSTRPPSRSGASATRT
ncbi:MAG TPA: hypothetical protein VHF51_17385 [Solirubrobacteraceae bacterium]|nr:hypothetical protein [Solirubrobacteraceae bacterium]